jgi:hypothetical protein
MYQEKEADKHVLPPTMGGGPHGLGKALQFHKILVSIFFY